MESADMLLVDCGEPVSPSKMKSVEMLVIDCGEPAETSKEMADELSQTVEISVDELSKTMEIPVASAEEVADELSRENARLKQKLECLQAILLGSAAQQGGCTHLQAKTRARRLSCPVQPPPAIPEFEPVYHQIRPGPLATTPQGCLPGTPPNEEEPRTPPSRPCRRSIVPTLDCSPSRPSTTPRVDCGEDDEDFDDEEGIHESYLLSDSDSDSGKNADGMPEPLSTTVTVPLLNEKRSRDESVCGVPACVIA